eukprot:CAMPEP_0174740836 /NCGR_PEP_ID=MMETSP1094-20130205/74614_1 /TAXON_ID=156173 /ORGANISM="Chrysochromulina brevifilum, Strain UTEX LB 985" /LENGTH=49 /DNA_ID= /DNA_START= /DNA_END= /DNA_ORIENTATION=
MSLYSSYAMGSNNPSGGSQLLQVAIGGLHMKFSGSSRNASNLRAPPPSP